MIKLIIKIKMITIIAFQKSIKITKLVNNTKR